MQDFSFENKITEGIVQYIKEIKISFDLMEISIEFRSLDAKRQTIVSIEGLFNFSLQADSFDDFDENGQLDYIQSLIRFDYNKTENGYQYCLKTDAYEMIFESKHLPLIEKKNN